MIIQNSLLLRAISATGIAASLFSSPAIAQLGTPRLPDLQDLPRFPSGVALTAGECKPVSEWRIRSSEVETYKIHSKELTDGAFRLSYNIFHFSPTSIYFSAILPEVSPGKYTVSTILKPDRNVETITLHIVHRHLATINKKVGDKIDKKRYEDLRSKIKRYPIFDGRISNDTKISYNIEVPTYGVAVHVASQKTMDIVYYSVWRTRPLPLELRLVLAGQAATEAQIGPTFICPEGVKPPDRVVRKAPPLVEKAAKDVSARAPQPTPNQPEKPNGIWWEHELAQATGGYDAKNDRTLINSYNVVVTGPTSLEGMAKDIVEQCVSVAASSGYEAFNNTPGEAGARIGAALATFKVTLVTCFKTKSISDKVAERFNFDYMQRSRWVAGAVLKFDSKHPVAENYRRLHDAVKDKIPEPLNKLIRFYIDSHELPQVDIQLDVPQDIRKVLAELPDPKEVREFMAAVEKLADKDGKKILTAVKEQIQKEYNRVLEDIKKNPLETMQAGVKLTGKIAEEAVKAFDGVRIKFPDISVDIPNFPLPKFPLPKFPDKGPNLPSNRCVLFPQSCGL